MSSWDWSEFWFWIGSAAIITGVSFLIVLGLIFVLSIIALPFFGIGALMWWFKELFLIN